MLEPITYRKVYGKNGEFEHLELCQGGNVIKISLALEGTHYAGYRWDEVAKVVSSFADRARKEAEELTGYEAPSAEIMKEYAKKVKETRDGRD